MPYILLLSTVLGCAHVYLWRRLVRDTAMRGLARTLATALLCMLAPSVPGTFLLWLLYSRDAGGGVPVIAFSWLGVMFYLVLLLVAWDAVRIAAWLKARFTPRSPAPARSELAVRGAAASVSAPASPDGVAPGSATLQASATETRRVFVARSVAASACVAACGLSALGLRSALFELTTPEVPVGLQRFPRALDGYKLALLSDIHIGQTLDGRFLRSVVERTNHLRPDLIAIAGDLVDGSVAHLGSHVAELARLRARHGVYFVTGNHEYYSGAEQWIAFLRKLGIRVLMNERIALGDPGASFELAGVPDLFAGRSRGHIAPDANAATAGRDPERELVMLAHQPNYIRASAEVGVGLQLSGHTHGGQLYPFGAVALLGQPYLAGLHQHRDTGTQIYVSRGTGFIGPPMRVFAPAEITQLRLHSV